MELIKAYRVIEIFGLIPLNEWLDENRDIEIISIQTTYLPHMFIDKYILLYKKII
jgi:hypothetical protein